MTMPGNLHRNASVKLKGGQSAAFFNFVKDKNNNRAVGGKPSRRFRVNNPSFRQMRPADPNAMCRCPTLVQFERFDE